MGFGRQYPIFNKITACIYKGKKDYGVKDTGETEIYVGSSAKNSTLFMTHRVTKRDKYIEEYGHCIVFTFFADKLCIKQMVFLENDKGKAGNLVKTNTFGNTIKYDN
jgi:hypothetical protein|tara:strand:+ start:150 stop:470 length:321 start_codon:yes stop_codon:yes gene_type:complete